MQMCSKASNCRTFVVLFLANPTFIILSGSIPIKPPIQQTSSPSHSTNSSSDATPLLSEPPASPSNSSNPKSFTSSTVPPSNPPLSTQQNIFKMSLRNCEDIVELILNPADRDEHRSSATTAVPNAGYSSKEETGVDVNDPHIKVMNTTERPKNGCQINGLSHHKISDDVLRNALEEVLRRRLNQPIFFPSSEPSDVFSLNSTNSTSTSEKGNIGSQLICQFFVFGTLFGVVCSISTCTCCLQPRAERRRNSDLNGVNPSNVPAPIDYSKPYMIKCDSRGSCYASPLTDDEVPPLPSYSEALTCPTYPVPSSKPSSESSKLNPPVIVEFR
ncbi:hypothetical protein AB6A40_002385 [Gnathostoma spinigerum]|uniref:Uncharacterized protein n=1 Tax=Gnathostoma spinigerum TaxID=75299 RepID=A0ABD6E908_9BILA